MVLGDDDVIGQNDDVVLDFLRHALRSRRRKSHPYGLALRYQITRQAQHHQRIQHPAAHVSTVPHPLSLRTWIFVWSCRHRRRSKPRVSLSLYKALCFAFRLIFCKIILFWGSRWGEIREVRICRGKKSRYDKRMLNYTFISFLFDLSVWSLSCQFAVSVSHRAQLHEEQPILRILAVSVSSCTCAM